MSLIQNSQHFPSMRNRHHKIGKWLPCFISPVYVLSALSQQTHKSPPIYFHCPDKHNTLHRIIFDPEVDGKGNNQEATINMKKPSVYIIYYPDDIYHRNVVRHLADFLKRVGCCDVRIDMLDAEIIMQLSKPTYVVQQWKTARCKIYLFFVLSLYNLNSFHFYANP